MRTGKLTIGAQEYPLCFSTRVLCDVTEQYGSLQGFYDTMTTGELSGRLETVLWILGKMLAAGKRYAALNGQDTPEPPTETDLWDLLGADDLAGLSGTIMTTITGGTHREVEAEPPKNG